MHCMYTFRACILLAQPCLASAEARKALPALSSRTSGAIVLFGQDVRNHDLSQRQLCIAECFAASMHENVRCRAQSCIRPSLHAAERHTCYLSGLGTVSHMYIFPSSSQPRSFGSASDFGLSGRPLICILRKVSTGVRACPSRLGRHLLHGRPDYICQLIARSFMPFVQLRTTIIQDCCPAVSVHQQLFMPKHLMLHLGVTL